MKLYLVGCDVQALTRRFIYQVHVGDHVVENLRGS
jgi:hypothetical protein